MTDQDSETKLSDVLDTIHLWEDAFEKSEEFARLSQAQQREARGITETFAQHSYEHLGESPEQWTPRSVRKICTEILPRKVSAEPAFFETIAPVLSEFFNFLERQGIFAKAQALARTAASSHQELVANSQDQSTWEPAKHFIMSARDAGVDFRNPEALDAFIETFNRQFWSCFRVADPASSSWRVIPSSELLNGKTAVG